METILGKRIIELRKSLNINQTELGRRLGVSPMAISRWERNLGAPEGVCLIRLGNLAHKNAGKCWSFWNLAGLTVSDVIRVLPIAEKRLRRTIPVLQIVKKRKRKTRLNLTEDSLAAIPLLDMVAAAGKGERSSNADLAKARTEHFIAAPHSWWPNPKHTVCVRVTGSSMEPTLFDGHIIVVDQAQTDKKKLQSKIIVAHHDKFGLVVSRFFQAGGTEALVSDNRDYNLVPWSPAWRVVGKVLWQIEECGAE